MRRRYRARVRRIFPRPVARLILGQTGVLNLQQQQIIWLALQLAANLIYIVLYIMSTYHVGSVAPWSPAFNAELALSLFFASDFVYRIRNEADPYFWR